MKLYSDFEIGSKSLIIFAMKGGGAVFNILAPAIIVKYVDISIYGRFVYIKQISIMFLSLTLVGVSNLLIREISKLRKGGRTEDFKSLAIYIFVVTIVVVGVGEVVGVYLFSKSSIRFLLTVYLVVSLLLNVEGSIILGFDYTISSQLIQEFSNRFLFLVYIYCFKSRLTPVFLFGLYTLASFTACLLGMGVMIYVVKKRYRREGRLEYKADFPHKNPRKTVYSWVGDTFVMSASAALLQFANTLPCIILKSFDMYDSIAVLDIVMRFVSAISLVLSSVNTVVAPKIAFYGSEINKNISHLKYLTRMVAKVSFVASLFFFISVWLARKFIISIFSISEISGFNIALLLLGLSQIVNSFVGPVALLSNMSNNERAVLLSILKASILSSLPLFCIFEWPKYIFVIVIVYISLNAILWNLFLWRFVCRKFKFNPAAIGG